MSLEIQTPEEAGSTQEKRQAMVFPPQQVQAKWVGLPVQPV
jgi:hypothetical protein